MVLWVRLNFIGTKLDEVKNIYYIRINKNDLL